MLKLSRHESLSKPPLIDMYKLWDKAFVLSAYKGLLLVKTLNKFIHTTTLSKHEF